MNLCSDNHDEVCFVSRVCPVCLVISEIEEANGEIASLKDQIENLENQLEEGK